MRLVIREELLWSKRKACTLNRKLLSCTTVAAANSALFYMPRDEFGHLEHADLLLLLALWPLTAVKYNLVFMCHTSYNLRV